jgi:hypothetical protein
MDKRLVVRRSAMLVMVLALSMGSGCLAALLVGAGAGIAGTAYYEGKLTGTVDAKPQEIQAATEKAFTALKIQQTSSMSDALKANLTGKTEKDNSVTVSVELQKNGKSKVGIRVGTFGDKEVSEEIFTAIREQLPKKPAKKEAAK